MHHAVNLEVHRYAVKHAKDVPHPDIGDATPGNSSAAKGLYLNDGGMDPVNRLFSNLREVMFGMMLSSVGMVPVSCKQAGWSRCVCKLSK